VLQAEVLEARSSLVELVKALRKCEEEVETCEGEVATLRDALDGNESQKKALQIQVRYMGGDERRCRHGACCNNYGTFKDCDLAPLCRESLLPTTGWPRLIGCLKLQVVFRK